MNTKHTPGPWTAVTRSNGEIEVVTDDGNYEMTVATVYQTGKLAKEQAPGNAQILAAAPELLEALAALADDSWSDISGQPCVPNKATVEAARAALAKAGAL
jgi:hypothetical protein